MSHFFSELREGWRDLLGAAIGLGCGIGCYTPVSSLFFRALEHEFAWSKAASAASLLALPATALILPAVGWLVDRLGMRRVAFASSLLLSLCFLGLSTQNGALPAFYAWFLALNLLGVGAGPISYTRVVAQRFEKGRGAALAVALVGIAACGMIMPPVLAQVLAQAGWRVGYQVLAGVSLVGGVVAFFCIRPLPVVRRAAAQAGDGLVKALTSRAFWCLGLAIFCISAASIGFVSQFQSLLIERGVGARQAAWLLSLLAASVVVSRLIIGSALDGGAPRRVAALTLVAAAIGVGLFIGTPSYPLILVGVILLGVSIGGELDLLSFFCARSFGLQRYGTLYGALSAFFYTGMAFGGLMYSLIHDRTGDYVAAVAISSGFFLLSAGLFYLIPDTAPEGAAAPAPAASDEALALTPLEQP